MFPFKDIGGFKIFLPRDCDIEKGVQTLKHINAVNREFLETHASITPQKRITGTFICAHAPDYYGRPMLRESVADWEAMFHRFKENGVDTVIFQAALWAELEECYYETLIFPKFKRFRVIENMLEAAANESMDVYLGNYGSVLGWANKFDDQIIAEEMKKHRLCFEELRNLGKVKGFYFPCESAFMGRRDLRQERKINTLYRHFSDMVKGSDTSLEIISSPGTKYFPNCEEAFVDSWNASLENVHLDIMMPQDSVGCGGCTLDVQPLMWSLWSKICNQNSCKLWGNIELFERRSFTEKVNLYPASPTRIAHQINQVGQYAAKLCCWEMQYFPTADAGEEGLTLAEFLKK